MRILIYGVTGSGKTTLARRLSEKTGIPWHEVDQLTFEPGWRPVPDDLQRQRISAICDEEHWILDTAYGKWLEIPLCRADLIVGLDYARCRSLGRLLFRTLRRIIDKNPVCNGNLESLRLALSRDSIILWHFRSFARKRRRMHEWKRRGLPVLLLRSPGETERWLANTPLTGP